MLTQSLLSALIEAVAIHTDRPAYGTLRANAYASASDIGATAAHWHGWGGWKWRQQLYYYTHALHRSHGGAMVRDPVERGATPL